MAKNINVNKAVQLRQGEGVLVPAKVETRVGVSGATEVGLNFDIANAPVPTRRYVAEIAYVEPLGLGVKMFFGQKRIGGGFRSMVIIQMTKVSAGLMLTNIATMTPSLAEIVQIQGLESEPLTEVNSEPDQAIEVVANFSTMAVAGEEACIDFYHASPFSVRNAQTTSRLGLEPVVRVDLRAALLLGVISEVERLTNFRATSQGRKE